MRKEEEWFASWFDSPFYHLLYKHRDEIEAQTFIDKLFEHLKPSKEDNILDLACGRGRHAIYMNAKGFKVTGYDLSEDSINFAKDFDNPSLHFDVRDMRENLGTNEFDWVFNLFTSFGYFDEPREDHKAIESIAKCLKTGGKLVLDFMNASKVAKRLVPREHKSTHGIDFFIERYTEGDHIIKEIKFTAEGKDYRFEEKVKTLNKSDFERLFNDCNLKLLECFGNLDLDAFDEEKSDRLIMVAEKI